MCLPSEQSRQEAKDRGQSRRKPNVTDSLCRKSKLADTYVHKKLGKGKEADKVHF